MTRWEFREQAFFRNGLIAENSHFGFALVHPDRDGGTENTIQHYDRFEKTCYLAGQDGFTYLRSLAPENLHAVDFRHPYPT